MNGDDEALAIMRGWNWERWDHSYDMPRAVPLLRDLSEAVNQLAMDGCNDPADTILSLLVAGKLMASGDWRWSAYKNFEHYQNEDGGIIPTTRWEAMAAIKGELDAHPFDNSYDPKVNLEKLGYGETEKFEWEWRYNRFSFACASEGDWPQKSEEYFTAQDIELLPPEREADRLAVAPVMLPTPAIAINGGGRPTTYEWERAIAAIVFQWADEGSWQPTSQADVQRALGDWFAGQGKTPSDSLLKERARWLFQEFASRNPDGQ